MGVLSLNAATMYAINTTLAAAAAAPPLTRGLENKYWHVKNVVNGRNTIAMVNSMSFRTTELLLVCYRYVVSSKLWPLHTGDT